MYEYHCTIERIVDGDTVDCSIDLGFNVVLSNQRIRLFNIDAPEVRTRDLEEKERGLSAAKFVEQLLPVGSKQVLLSRKYYGELGKYGRIIGDFKIYDAKYDSQMSLTKIMLREGHAEEVFY